MKDLFSYMLDHALCSHTLRITDFDMQRMLLKKEVRIAFLVMSFLSQIHQSMQTDYFAELVESSIRFKARMQCSIPMVETFDRWFNSQPKAESLPAQSVTDVAFYAIVIQYAISKTIHLLLKGPSPQIDWLLLLEKNFNNSKMSEISLHLLTELQSDTQLSRD